MTRTHVRLLGPCFKTGRRRRRPTRNRDAGRASGDTRYTSPLSYPPGTELGDQGSGTSPELHPDPQSAPSGSLREGLEKCCHRQATTQRKQPPYGPITLYGPWPQSRWTWTGRFITRRLSRTPHAARPRWPAVRCWALPVSFAITRGITVVFFSSAY